MASWEMLTWYMTLFPKLGMPGLLLPTAMFRRDQSALRLGYFDIALAHNSDSAQGDGAT